MYKQVEHKIERFN